MAKDLNIWLYSPVQTFHLAIYLFNILSFLGYGTSCLATTYMVKEFERYLIPELRVAAGLLQIISAVILLCGFLEPWFVVFGALQLMGMMATGVFVRSRIGDSLFKMFPAVFYLILNAIILIGHLFYGVRLPEV